MHWLCVNEWLMITNDNCKEWKKSNGLCQALSQNLNDCILNKAMENLSQDRSLLVEILNGSGNYYISSADRRSRGLLVTCM